MPYFPPSSGGAALQGAKVYLSTDQSNIGTSAVKILFDTETYDVGGNFASNKYTVPTGQAGYYLVTLNVYMYGSITDGSQNKAMIYVNGANVAENNMIAGAANIGLSPCITTVVYLAVGAYVEFYCQNANANADIYSSAAHTFGVVQQLVRD